MKEFFGYIIKFDLRKLFIEPSVNIFIQMFRYAFVGGLAFIVDAGCLFVFERIGIHYLISAAFAFIAGLIVNYILSTNLVFRPVQENNNQKISKDISGVSNSKSNQRSHTAEFTIYGIIGVIGLAFTELIMYVCTEVLGMYFMISKIIAAVLVLIWNFAARKIILYRK